MKRSDIKLIRSQLECLQGYIDADDQELKKALVAVDELIRLFGLAKLASKVLSEVHQTLRPQLLYV